MDAPSNAPHNTGPGDRYHQHSATPAAWCPGQSWAEGVASTKSSSWHRFVEGAFFPRFCFRFFLLPSFLLSCFPSAFVLAFFDDNKDKVHDNDDADADDEDEDEDEDEDGDDEDDGDE